MPEKKRALTFLDPEELGSLGRRYGLKGFQCKILQDFIWKNPVIDFEDMTSLSKSVRKSLHEQQRLYALDLREEIVSADGTRKFLWQEPGGDTVESVLIPSEEGNMTACISTQIGCAMACVFCASTVGGLQRNLEAAEIVEQVLQMQARMAKRDRIARIVVMGMGEPLANFSNLVKALDTIHHRDFFGMGARRITVSTVGLPDRIRQFAALSAAYNLAISLHAPNDSLRNRLIPSNAGTGIKDILRAADDFFRQTGREYTVEYILIADCNDSEEICRELGALLRGRRCVINLIPMNSVAASEFGAPDPAVLQRFADILVKEFRIPTHVRRRKGEDIAAACGQLRWQRKQGV